MRSRMIGLSVWASLLAIGLFGLPLGMAVYQYAVQAERSDLQEDADRLAIEVAGAVSGGDDVGDLDRCTPVQVAVYDEDGDWLGGSWPGADGPELTRALDGEAATGADDEHFLVAVPVTHEDDVIGALGAAVPRSAVWQRVLPIWVTMVLLAVLAVAVAYLVGRRQARRLARPLEDLAVTARRLGDGDFSARSRTGGVPEIDAVGSALNSTAGRLDDLLARERAFSADASHQLRTPLAGLRLRLESALERHDADLRPAVTASLADADRLEATIAELLALARDPRPARSAPVDPAGLLGEPVPGWSGQLVLQGRTLDVRIEPGVPAPCASVAAVRQVLAVLVDNATTHGSGTVTITVREAAGAVAIDVGDEGPGVDGPETLLFARRVDPRDGHGIGLALARRLAEAQGGRLQLTRAAPPVFTLLLPWSDDGAPDPATTCGTGAGTAGAAGAAVTSAGTIEDGYGVAPPAAAGSSSR